MDGWYGIKCDFLCFVECLKCNFSDFCDVCLYGFELEGSKCIFMCKNCKD